MIRNSNFLLRTLLFPVVVHLLLIVTVIGCSDEEFIAPEGDDRAHAIVQLPDGGFILAGATNTCGDPEGRGCDFAGFLVRVDDEGGLVWEKRFPQLATVVDLALTGDGQIAVIGNLPASITKLDINGEVVWTSGFGEPNEYIANSLLVPSDGGLVILGTRNEFGTGISKMFLSRYDDDGNEIWRETYGTSGVGVGGGSATVTSDGSFLLAGFRENSPYVVKTTSLGDEIWSRAYTISGTSSSSAGAIGPTSTGGAIVAIVGRDEEYVYSTTFISIDEDGNVLWQRTLSIYLHVGARHNLLILDNDDFLLTRADDADGFFDMESESENPYAIMMDSLGGELWSRIYPDDIGSGIGKAILLLNGNFALAGTTSGWQQDEMDPNIFRFAGGDMVFAVIDPDGDLLQSQTYSHKEPVSTALP